VNVREAMAVVSKPGGGTLLDSLAAATPIVLLTPWGEPEAKNGALWEELGFGIDFQRWRETGFDHRVLEDLHHRLLEAREHDIEPLVAEAVG
jgi:UDP-N-acetylglucosamine:LPS N-acetylglucosamine transferase